MDRAQQLLQLLRSTLETRHKARITRTLKAEVSFLPLTGGNPGEFQVVLTPQVGGDPYISSFTRARVFGTLGVGAQKEKDLIRKSCDYTTDLIREYLQFKGVL